MLCYRRIRHLGFPTTQQVADINRRAAEKEKKKQELMEHEARCVSRLANWVRANGLLHYLERKMGSIVPSGEVKTAVYM
jgi:hypothetical protein